MLPLLVRLRLWKPCFHIFKITLEMQPAKSHPYGWIAENAVEEAREKVANLIGARAKEIIFTSGATEAINLGIKGVF